jgi:hypothetical protein
MIAHSSSTATMETTVLPVWVSTLKVCGLRRSCLISTVVAGALPGLADSSANSHSWKIVTPGESGGGTGPS